MEAAATPPIIEARRLTKIYSPDTFAVTGLNAVDLRIAEGEMVVLKGNSGSGKSTLLSLLGGLDTPSDGMLVVAGHDLRATNGHKLTFFRRNIIGMVFQAFNLLPTLTVIENICLPAQLAGKPGHGVLERATELLSWLQMDKRRHHLPAQLSGGEMQRTAIARALINDPPLILADEPTGNLDSRNGETVIQILAALNREFGRTVIIATHSTIADAFADRQICLKDGGIIRPPCDA